jgi:acetate---CoA ligase (ADP-forming)
MDAGERILSLEPTAMAAPESPAAAARAAAPAGGLAPIFRPRAVAVVGASRDPSGVGHLVLKKIVAGGFTGPVYPVNPKARSIASIPCVASIAELPDGIDLAVLALPAAAVEAAIRQALDRGIRGFVVLSAGFAETGEAGAAAEKRLRELVRSRGARMIGPNCLGFLTTRPEIALDATFAPAVPPAGAVAMASQSGALGVAILDTARELNLGLSEFVSVGNKADVSSNDLLEFWEDDPRTQLILLYLESFGNPRRFARIARRVARKKPILAVKAGRTAAGRRAAGSHTAALAASERCVEAVLEHAGVLRATTLEEMFDVATLLACQPLPAGPRVALLTNAGGPAILCTDACGSLGLEVPALAAATREKLAPLLAPAASLMNPVDMTAAGSAEQYRRVLPILLDDDQVDAVIALFIPAGIAQVEAVAQALRDGRAAARSGRAKPLLTCFMGMRGVPAALRGADESIPSFRFPESAAGALAQAWRRSAWLHRPEGSIPAFGDVDVARARQICAHALERRGPGWLAPDEIAPLLQSFGVATLPGALCRSAADAVVAAQRFGGPVALKLASLTLIHKSDVGGVHLDLRGAEAVRAAWSALERALESRGRRGEMLGAWVQPMAPAGVDVMVGAIAEEKFGPIVAFGLGGTTVELLGDVAFRLAPLTDRDASDLVRAIRGYPLLDGWRGSPPGDVAALEQLLLRVALLADRVPEILELDLNPVRVLPKGQGALALDARVRVGPPQSAR